MADNRLLPAAPAGATASPQGFTWDPNDTEFPDPQGLAYVNRTMQQIDQLGRYQPGGRLSDNVVDRRDLGRDGYTPEDLRAFAAQRAANQRTLEQITPGLTALKINLMRLGRPGSPFNSSPSAQGFLHGVNVNLHNYGARRYALESGHEYPAPAPEIVAMPGEPSMLTRR